MSQILDYVWVNEDYEIVMESISSIVYYNNVKDLPPYCSQDIMIKPNQLFKNPFKSSSDLIVLCDMYHINNLTEPPQIILAEQNQRKEFNDYMETYPSITFKISQTYNYVKNLFREHKQMCSYIGIDVFGKPSEYIIYTNKENVYNYVWVSRYVLYQLSLNKIEWHGLILSPNNDEEIVNKVKSLEVNSIDDLLDRMNI